MKSHKIEYSEESRGNNGTIGKQAYFVSASAGAHRHTLYQIEWLLNRGAQPNLIANAFLPEHWNARRQATGNVHFHPASKNQLKSSRKLTYMYSSETP